MGEFSLRDWKAQEGVLVAVVAAGLLIAVPFVLSFVIEEWFSGTLTPHGSRALSAFILYAVILGVAVALAIFLYGGYQKGSRPRLLFGMVSGALIIVYSLIVLVASGVEVALSDIGLRLDTTFAASTVIYASVVLMFSVGGEYIASRVKNEESKGAAVSGQGGTE